MHKNEQSSKINDLRPGTGFALRLGEIENAQGISPRANQGGAVMQVFKRTGKKGSSRSPEQMAKAAMRVAAEAELQANGLGTEIKITVEYMGQKQTIVGKPSVKLETGQIGFYASATGVNRLLFASGNSDIPRLSFGVGCNVGTGQQIDSWAAILSQYGLSAQTQDEADEAGEA